MRASLFGDMMENTIDTILKSPSVKVRLHPVPAGDDCSMSEALQTAIDGCSSVIHVVSLPPSDNAAEELRNIATAEHETLAVLNACIRHNIKRNDIKRFVLSCCAFTFGGETSRSEIYTKKLPDEQTNSGVAQFECLNSIEEAAKRCVDDLPIEARFELCFLNTITIQGPILTPTPRSDNFFLIESLMDGNLPLVPRTDICFADVRGVALAHVRALSVPASRYVIHGSVVSMQTVARVLHGEFRCQGYNIPNSRFLNSLSLMTSKFKKKIRKMLPTHNKFKAKGDDELERVMGITPRDVKETILDTAYSLIDNGLARKLESYRQRPPHIKLINDYRDILLRCIDCNAWVLTYLTCRQIITRTIEDEIRAEKMRVNKNSILLRWLKENRYEIFQKFLDTLKSTEQEHVANLLTENIDDKYPLPERLARRLQRLKCVFIEMLKCELGALMENLDNMRIVSKSDMGYINSEKGNYAKNCAIFESVIRRSNHDLNNFHQALTESDQEYLAWYLFCGEVARVHIKTSRPEREEELSSYLYTATELDAKGLVLIHMRCGNGMVGYVYYNSVEAATWLLEIVENGKMHTNMERILTELIPADKEKSVFIRKVSLDENDKDFMQ